ncbi:MAG: S26 family signal peptidase [bacterium]
MYCRQLLVKYRIPLIILVSLPLISISVLLYAHYIGYFGWNYQTCVKPKYFYVNRLNKNIPAGAFFVFKFKGTSLYPKGSLFVKYMRCVPGDKLKTVKINNHYRYYCNGKYLGYGRNYSEHGKGFKLPHFIFNGIIPKDRYFAMGTAWDSYDSRYWGFVRKKEIIGIAYPLIK